MRDYRTPCGLRKLKLFLSLLMLIAFSVGNVWAADYELVYTLNGSVTGGNNAYTEDGGGLTQDGVNWSVTGNTTIDPWRIGGKNLDDVDREAYSKTAISDNIAKIEIEHGTKTLSAVNSMTVIVASNSDFSTVVSSFTPTFEASKTVTILRPDGKDWSNCYYKIVYNVDAGSSNSYLQLKSVKFYKEKSASDPVLESITISGDLSNKSYEEGQSIDFTGLTATGHYNNSSTADLTDDVEWSFSPALTAGLTSVTVTATLDEITSAEYNVTGLSVTEHVVTPGAYDITPNNTFFNTTASGSITGTDANLTYTGTQNDITVTYAKGSQSNMYINATQTRAYNGSVMTFSVPSGYNITAIAFTADGNNWSGTHTASAGTMTDNKNWSGAANSVTITFGGTCRITGINVTYEATVPTVTATPNALEFEAKQNIAVDGKTFTLTSANLTSGLTLAASAGFNVSPESITAADAMAQGGVAVTVSPATPTATTTPVEGTVTISGGGLTDNVVVNLSMAVTPTYLVAIAVNDGDMGSATLNGGTASIYVTDDEEIALVATPESGHEFVNWTVSDENIILNNANAASTTAMAGAAGTITANFQAQACTGLAAPVLDDVTTTYQSATIAWNAVDNAEGYVLNLKKHEGNVSVLTDELIVAPTVSFEKTGLAANTQYDYSIMAVGDGTSFCDESNPLLEGNFTTNDYPSVAVTYSENGNSVSGGSKKIMTPFALPDEVTNEISGKTFVGWTTKSDFEDGDESDEETYFAKGANFTIQSNAAVTLYAVYATAAGGAGSTWVINKDNFSTVSTGSGYAPYNGDHTEDGITYNTNQVMLLSQKVQFQKNNGVMYNKTAFDADIVSIAIDGIDANITVYEGAEEISTGGTSITLADGVYPFSSGKRYFRIKMGNATGTATSITVNLAGATSYSDYVISGSAALPVLDAPTGLTAGTYYEAQTITLAATNGADIFYTLDGSEPTTSSTKYTVPFTVDATKTIKAIAAKEGFENSAVAEAIYTIGKTFASVSDLFTYLEAESLTSMNNVKVTGLVSRITAAWDAQKGYLTYYISDNGQAENDLQMYRGVGLEADQVKVGDQVTVTGNYVLYNSSIHEFAAGNTIVARTAATVASLSIGGAAEKTIYSSDDNVFSHAGLTATATYNTGYEKDVTADATWTNNLTNNIVEATGTVEVTATYEGQSDMEEVAVTYTSKTLKSIYLEYESTYTFVGNDLPKPKVYAEYEEEIADDEITSLVEAANGYDTESAYNKDVAGDYTIKVAYNTFEAIYTVQVRKIFDNEDAPHNVADARALIVASEYQSTTSSTDYMWVRGKVVGDAYTSSNKPVYYISDDGTSTGQLYVYNAKYFDGTTTTVGNVKQGDEVVLKATILNYNGSTAELTNSRVTYQLREGALAIENVAELEVGQDDLAEADLTIERNGSNGTITFVSGNTDALTVVDNKLHAVAAGDATVTATMAATENTGSINFTEATTTFNVHVIAAKPRYAVTFDADGGEGDDPVIEDQLAGATVDLPTVCPYSKANSAFDAWVVNETESGDAVTITDGHFTMPAAAVTIKATWNTVDNCTISFMVNGAEVATATAPQTAAYDLTQVAGQEVAGFTFVGWCETEYEDEVTVQPTIITSYTPAVNEENKVLYGIYKQEISGENKHYVLDYATDVASESISYGNPVDITATDGSAWVVSASKQTGMQINTGKSAYIKVPNCPAKIVQIVLTCNNGTKKAVAFSETSNGSALVSAPADGTTQTLDFSEVNVSAGYIIPSAGNCQITHIDVEYSGNVTYYSSSPVTRYMVTYLKGEATSVTGLCEAERKAAGTITLCDAPTCADKDFAKWSDGENLYEAGAEYTLSADVTFTATWAEKPNFTVTYVANGGIGTAPEAEEYKRDATVTVKSNTFFTNPGYTFDGWIITYNDGTDHVITPEDGKFTMPAYNVVIKATWAEESKQKWALVANVSDLEAGKKYIIAAAESNVAMAGQNTNNRAETAVVKKNEGAVLMGTSSMQIFTLEGTTDAWAFNTGAGYLYAADKNSNYLRTQETNNVNGQWTITITDGAASVVAAGSSNRNVMQYNSSSKIFSCYSTASQNAVALYKEIPVTEINTNTDETAVPDNGDMIIGEDKTWTVNNDKIVGDLYMNEGAIIYNSAAVTTNDLYFSSQAGKSNQIIDANQLNVTGDFYYDFKLCDGDLDPDYWYSISVPFDVEVNGGVMLKNGTLLTYRTDFEIWEYDTEKRAQTMVNGWKRLTSNKMQAGRAYLIGFNPGTPNVIRFKAAAGWKANLFSGNSISVTTAEAADGTHSNWNGLSNPMMRYIDVNTLTQVYNNNTHGWDSYDPAALQFNFVVGTAFFVQSTTAVGITTTDHHEAYRAPSRENESQYAYAVRISKAEATNFDNQIIVRATSDATNSYEQGHDMLTMNDATSNTTAMLWTKNYGGKRLAVEEAPFVASKAVYELGIYAPVAGEYSISVAQVKENADLYLTYNGSIIWNLSMNEYTGEFAKGNNEGYGLILVKKAPQVGTGVENAEANEAGVQKVIINDHVYILRAEQMYDVTGKMVK